MHFFNHLVEKNQLKMRRCALQDNLQPPQDTHTRKEDKHAFYSTKFKKGKILYVKNVENKKIIAHH